MPGKGIVVFDSKKKWFTSLQDCQGVEVKQCYIIRKFNNAKSILEATASLILLYKSLSFEIFTQSWKDFLQPICDSDSQYVTSRTFLYIDTFTNWFFLCYWSHLGWKVWQGFWLFEGDENFWFCWITRDVDNEVHLRKSCSTILSRFFQITVLYFSRSFCSIKAFIRRD